MTLPRRALRLKAETEPRLAFPAWTMSTAAVHDPSKRDEYGKEAPTPADVPTCRYCGVDLRVSGHVLSFERHLELHNAERAGEEPWVEPTLESFGVEAK